MSSKPWLDENPISMTLKAAHNYYVDGQFVVAQDVEILLEEYGYIRDDGSVIETDSGDS